MAGYLFFIDALVQLSGPTKNDKKGWPEKASRIHQAQTSQKRWEKYGKICLKPWNQGRNQTSLIFKALPSQLGLSPGMVILL